MSTILSYLYEYVKTNHFTAIFAGTILGLASLKYLKIQLPSISTSAKLIFILGVGLALRLAWLDYSSHQPMMGWNEGHMLENDYINVHAIEATEGIWFHDIKGEPIARRPIGYPVLLAFVYKLFGVNLDVAWALNLILQLLTIALIYLIGKQIFYEDAGLLAAFLFAIYPVSIYSVKLLTDEHLFLPLWYFGIYLLSREVKGTIHPWSWLGYGLIFGYATMTRTHSIYMPLVVGFAYLLKKVPLYKMILSVLLVGFAMQLPNLPWIIRNYRIWGEPVLYTATGSFVYAQVNSSATPVGHGHVPTEGEEGYSKELDEAILQGNLAKIHRISNKEMKKWILTHPSQFLVLGLSRVLYFMNWNRQDGVWPLWYQYYEGSYDPAKPIPENVRKGLEECAFAFYYVLLYSSILAIFVIARQRKRDVRIDTKILLILAAVFGLYLLEHMIIYPIRKYRYPLEPFMMILAGYAFHYLLTEFRWDSIRDWKLFRSNRAKLVGQPHSKAGG